MSSSFDIIKELQNSYATEAMGDGVFEEVEVDPYRNSPLGECFRELDLIEQHEFATESLGETVRGNLCFYQDMAVARGEELPENFSIESLIEEKGEEYRAFLTSDEAVEMSFSTESLVNKAKRAGYALKINGKELVQKLLTWIKGIFDQYMVSDGKLKSYKKLIKKYREKLNTSTPSTKEDKEISIRQTKYKDRLSQYLNAIPEHGNIKTTDIKAATTVEGVVNALITQLETLMLGTGVPQAIKEGIALTGTAEDIQEMVKDKKLVDNVKDFLEDLKDEADPEDMSPSAALSYLSSQASQVEAAIKDRKYKKAIDNLVKAANDTMKKINKKKDAEATNDTVEASQKVAALGALVTQYRTHVLGAWTKAITSMLQALLADMAKLINANTRIKND